MLGFALESFVDVFSSILVLWRFWKGGSKNPVRYLFFSFRDLRLFTTLSDCVARKSPKCLRAGKRGLQWV